MSAQIERRSRGLLYILAATAISGAFAYLIQIVAPRLLPDATSYLAFSVFWLTLFLFGSAIAGVQQEVTRATHPAEQTTKPTPLRRFLLGGAAVLGAAAAGLSVLLGPVAFGAAPFWMGLSFALGLVGYFGFAVFGGVLYGLSRWTAIATLMIVDAALRGIAVTIGFIVGAPPGVLAALVALPFGITAVLLWFPMSRSVIGKIAVDVSLKRLAVNSASTIVAAASTAVMVTGLPLLLRTALPDENATTLASLTMAITLTRAPLIIPLIALQSFLIVDFRSARSHVWRRVGIYGSALIGLTALLAAAAWAWGPAVIEWISDGRYGVSSLIMATVVASAGLVALMCLTGPALLSETRHTLFVLGWVVAAGATVMMLALPLPSIERTLAALLVGPTLGLLVHLLSIRSGRPRAGRASKPEDSTPAR